jgi:hypothetical protein
MSQTNYQSGESLNRAITNGLDAGPVPPNVQAQLEKTYISLGAMPQDPSARGFATDGTTPDQGKGNRSASSKHTGHRIRRGMVVAIAAAITVMVCGSAFAATRLLQMQPGDIAFFQTGGNLPVYNSLQDGVSSLNASVGQSVTVDGVTMTLDSVSCDRSIVNLFFTIEKEGGFDLNSTFTYEGSQQNDWSRLQSMSPLFSYKLNENGETIETGSTHLLDAYMEDGKIKCMQRIVPEATLPDQVDVELDGSLRSSSNTSGDAFTFATGFDLSTVAAPRQLAAQDIMFHTSDGDKSLGIERFTASELGTVMVVRNDMTWTGQPLAEGSSYGTSSDVLNPSSLKVTDDQGNVLTPVAAGDGTGMSVGQAQIIEFANLSPQAQSVTFTPMLLTTDEKSSSIEDRQALSAKNQQSVDVSQIGTRLPMSEYGGYELTDWNVSDGTVSISLKPYGWLANTYIELIPEQQVTLLYSESTDAGTGETRSAGHSGIGFTKSDYQTGERVQIDSYYAASDEELLGLTQYHYLSSFGVYKENADAAVSLAFE